MLLFFFGWSMDALSAPKRGIAYLVCELREWARSALFMQRDVYYYDCTEKNQDMIFKVLLTGWM